MRIIDTRVSERVSVSVEELLLLCRSKTALQLEIVKFRCIHFRSWPEDIPRLRGLRVFLSIMVALCGLIQLYLMNISSTSLSPWIWNDLAIVGFLMGVLRYKIFD